jgi:hypothetical protein
MTFRWTDLVVKRVLSIVGLVIDRHFVVRTTMRYDRARKNLDRHPNYILAAYMASGT